MFYKIISASLVTASFSIAAMAQTNLQAESTRIMDNWSGPFNALSIHVCMDRRHKSYTGSALQEAFAVEQNRIVKLLNRGDSVQAAGLADSMIKAFGHCYTKSDKQAVLPTYARYMGGFIATDALVYDNDDKMQQAITLLDYANQHGQTNTQFLDLVKEHRAAEPNTGNDLEITLSDLEKKLAQNALRFKRDYDKKAISFDGKVKSVAYNNLTRKTQLSFKEASGSLVGTCSFKKGGAMENKAIDLNAGDSITISANIHVYVDILGEASLHVRNCQF